MFFRHYSLIILVHDYDCFATFIFKDFAHSEIELFSFSLCIYYYTSSSFPVHYSYSLMFVEVEIWDNKI